MRFVWCLPDILATASLSICPLKLAKADQLQPPSIPCCGLPHCVAYKKEGSSGDITIDMYQGSFCKYAEMQKAESKYLTDSEGSIGLVCFLFYFVLQLIFKDKCTLI